MSDLMEVHPYVLRYILKNHLRGKIIQFYLLSLELRDIFATFGKSIVGRASDGFFL